MTAPENIDEALLALQKMNLTVKKTAAGALRAGKADKYADLGEYNRIVLTALNNMDVIWTCLPTLSGETFVLAYSLKHVPSGTEKAGEFPLPKSEPQKMGSAITYGRRYALGAVTGVAAEDEDDDGSAASGQRYAQRANQRQQRAAAAPPTEDGQPMQRNQRPRGGQPPLPGESPTGLMTAKQRSRMFALWSELGIGDDKRDFRLRKTAEWIGAESLESTNELTEAEADRVIAALRERKEQQADTIGGDR